MGKRPENTVLVAPHQYWVIEAKANLSDLEAAVAQAKARATEINSSSSISCRLITGIAGTPDTTHYVTTYFQADGTWTPLSINGRESTGFISRSQANRILTTNRAELTDYDVDERLFRAKTESINKTLHAGGINKRNRASILACLLLALAHDERLPVHGTATTLISDINTRARSMLEQYGKSPFFNEISITLPTTEANHGKTKRALIDTIEALRDLNIASMINSGRDVLGQFYEQFLQYANDAKELGIVLTPRHITTFTAEIVGVTRDDIVLDPACGTGGFLVAALDKVRRDGGNVAAFNSGNLHGIEQDPLIATLAIINMIFRGDGSSNITEGDCFTAARPVAPSKVLMNPPFALDDEFEWKFVDRALEWMRPHGLLFAVLPPTSMTSTNNKRDELAWRTQLLQRHTLIAVIKLPEDLFYPNVSKGTYGVVIRAHRPHDIATDDVIWAILRDGVARVKTARNAGGGGAAICERSLRPLATSSQPAPGPGMRRWRSMRVPLVQPPATTTTCRLKTSSVAVLRLGPRTCPSYSGTWRMARGGSVQLRGRVQCRRKTAKYSNWPRSSSGERRGAAAERRIYPTALYRSFRLRRKIMASR